MVNNTEDSLYEIINELYPKIDQQEIIQKLLNIFDLEDNIQNNTLISQNISNIALFTYKDVNKKEVRLKLEGLNKKIKSLLDIFYKLGFFEDLNSASSIEGLKEDREIGKEIILALGSSEFKTSYEVTVNGINSNDKNKIIARNVLSDLSSFHKALQAIEHNYQNNRAGNLKISNEKIILFCSVLNCFYLISGCIPKITKSSSSGFQYYPDKMLYDFIKVCEEIFDQKFADSFIYNSYVSFKSLSLEIHPQWINSS